MQHEQRLTQSRNKEGVGRVWSVPIISIALVYLPRYFLYFGSGIVTSSILLFKCRQDVTGRGNHSRLYYFLERHTTRGNVSVHPPTLITRRTEITNRYPIARNNERKSCQESIPHSHGEVSRQSSRPKSGFISKIHKIKRSSQVPKSTRFIILV